MDLNSIKEAVEKLTKDDSAKDAFKQDPIKAVESVLGVDLPDEKVQAIIDLAKSKLEGSDVLDKIKDEAVEAIEGSIADKLKSLFK